MKFECSRCCPEFVELAGYETDSTDSGSLAELAGCSVFGSDSIAGSDYEKDSTD